MERETEDKEDRERVQDAGGKSQGEEIQSQVAAEARASQDILGCHLIKGTKQCLIHSFSPSFIHAFIKRLLSINHIMDTMLDVGKNLV